MHEIALIPWQLFCPIRDIPIFKCLQKIDNERRKSWNTAKKKLDYVLQLVDRNTPAEWIMTFIWLCSHTIRLLRAREVLAASRGLQGSWGAADAELQRSAVTSAGFHILRWWSRRGALKGERRRARLGLYTLWERWGWRARGRDHSSSLLRKPRPAGRRSIRHRSCQCTSLTDTLGGDPAMWVRSSCLRRAPTCRLLHPLCVLSGGKKV